MYACQRPKCKSGALDGKQECALHLAESTTLTVRTPISVAEVAALQKAAEDEHEIYALLACADAGDYEFADALLTAVSEREKAALAMRTEATGPLYGVIKTVEDWFRPYLSELKFAKDACKKVMGDYRVAQAQIEREARELAATAAETNDPETMIEALTVANIAAQKPEGHARVGLRWTVKRVVEGLLLESFEAPGVGKVPCWIPNAEAFEAFAAQHKGDDPPVISGVVFEQVARVAAGSKK